MRPAATELDSLQSTILKRVAEAASAYDVASVKRWSTAAEECEDLRRRAEDLQLRVEKLRAQLSDGAPREALSSIPDPFEGSARAQGVAARNEWVKRLAARGFRLVGSGKRYETSHGRIVGIAFANELPSYPDKWWLGLPDQATDVVALLCHNRGGAIVDIVLPVEELGVHWKALSRSNGQIKFNVRRQGRELLLLIPGSGAISVQRFVGNYEPLGSTAEASESTTSITRRSRAS
jgi:hypothetical protein